MSVPDAAGSGSNDGLGATLADANLACLAAVRSRCFFSARASLCALLIADLEGFEGRSGCLGEYKGCGHVNVRQSYLDVSTESVRTSSSVSSPDSTASASKVVLEAIVVRGELMEDKGERGWKDTSTSIYAARLTREFGYKQPCHVKYMYSNVLEFPFCIRLHSPRDCPNVSCCRAAYPFTYISSVTSL